MKSFLDKYSSLINFSLSCYDRVVVFRKREDLQPIYKEIIATAIHTVTEPKTENNRKYKGFNFFSKNYLSILLAILYAEFNINGFRNKNIKKLLGFNSTKFSRLIKWLRIHGLIKKATDSDKYYLTKMGKETIIMSQKIKELVLVPAFCY